MPVLQIWWLLWFCRFGFASDRCVITWVRTDCNGNYRRKSLFSEGHRKHGKERTKVRCNYVTCLLPVFVLFSRTLRRRRWHGFPSDGYIPRRSPCPVKCISVRIIGSNAGVLEYGLGKSGGWRRLTWICVLKQSLIWLWSGACVTDLVIAVVLQIWFCFG